MDSITVIFIIFIAVSIIFFSFFYFIKNNDFFTAIARGVICAISLAILAFFALIPIFAVLLGINTINEPQNVQTINDKIGNLDSQIELCKKEPKNINDTFKIIGEPLIYDYIHKEPWSRYAYYESDSPYIAKGRYQSIINSSRITLFLIYNKKTTFVKNYEIENNHIKSSGFQLSYDVCAMYFPDKTVIGSYTITGAVPPENFILGSEHSGIDSEENEDTNLPKGAITFSPNLGKWLDKLPKN